MKNLILVVCLMLTSVVFGQSEDDSIFYDLYWLKTDTLATQRSSQPQIVRWRNW